MGPFAQYVGYAAKTVYYHFSQADLNTAIVKSYEKGLRESGKPVDLWAMIAKRSGEEPTTEDAPSLAAEPAEPYRPQLPASVADLLREAARLLDEQERATDKH